jgi:hypothetical protein
MPTKEKPQFFDYLKQTGLKWTPRGEDLSRSLALEEFLEAEDLAYHLRRKEPNL